MAQFKFTEGPWKPTLGLGSVWAGNTIHDNPQHIGTTIATVRDVFAEDYRSTENVANTILIASAPVAMTNSRERAESFGFHGLKPRHSPHIYPTTMETTTINRKQAIAECLADPPKFILVRIEEHGDWQGDVGRDTETIGRVFLVDTNSITFACELTPSYYLQYLYSDVGFIDEISDEQKEAIEWEVHSMNRDEPGIYVSVSDFERTPNPFKIAGAPVLASHAGDPWPFDWRECVEEAGGIREKALELTVKAIREYESGNPTFC